MLLPRAFVGSGNDGFTCALCGAEVPPVTQGGYRNHCPHCLHSLHVDEAPGDRASTCGGLMEPVGLFHHRRKGYQIVHRCSRCSVVRRNRVVEDGGCPDDPEQLRLLSRLPLTSSPGLKSGDS